ncbi:MAG: LPS assembly lipoprotein LptE [Phycisphaerae bacterium]|nr:LPS assembly lipoprotein LptE [Phycisphaerae bacterium]
MIASRCRLKFPLIAAIALAALAGCSRYSAYPEGDLSADNPKPPLTIGGYRAGFIHPKNVNSVYVQVFASSEFRRELEFRLTEALVKRIMLDTQYKIAKKNDADTILYGEVKGVQQTLLGQDSETGLPKELQPVMIVDWTWKNRRTGEVLAQRRRMEQAGLYYPIAGETFFDGTEQAIDRLAKRIVEGMEADW